MNYNNDKKHNGNLSLINNFTMIKMFIIRHHLQLIKFHKAYDWWSHSIEVYEVDYYSQ